MVTINYTRSSNFYNLRIFLNISSKIMKVFFTILFLILSLQSLVKADDINEFEIEGISVGDSLLDHFSKDEIDNARKHQYTPSAKYPNTKFLIVRLQSYKNLEMYEQLSFTILKNDEEKIIHSVEGFIYYEKNIKECSKFKDEIVIELKNYINDENVKSYNSRAKHMQDESGKSIVEETIFLFPSEAVFRVSCTDWSEEMKFRDELRVVINSVKFSNYLRSLWSE
tara:strand:+ start:2420 stop:3094 length:675 start_codon:yes stop_codon:yes gene_type:complete